MRERAYVFDIAVLLAEVLHAQGRFDEAGQLFEEA
jgi:hypothetical protein